MHLIDSWDNNVVTADLAEQSINQLINKLQLLGITAGNRVLLISGSSSQWMILQSALSSIGAVIIPVDQENKIDLENKIQHANPHYILCVGEVDLGLSLEHYQPTNTGINAVYVLEHKYKETLDNSSKKNQFMIFTSGTSSNAKLAILNFDAVDRVVDFYVNEFSQYRFDKIIIALPLSAIYTICICLAASRLGKTLVFVRPKEQDVFTVLREYRADLFPAVPLVVELIYKKINSALAEKSAWLNWMIKLLLLTSIQVRRIFGLNIGRLLFASIHSAVGKSLKVILSGGAKIPKHVLYDMYGYGFTIYEGYGLTETSGVVTVRRGDYASIGSVGTPVNDVVIAMDSIDGTGQIKIKTKQAFSGYYDASMGVVRNDSEWVATGDVGYNDSSGALHVNGRMKNIITFSNELKANPELLEEALQKSSCISDPVIIGFDKEDSFGDHVVLFVEKGQHASDIDLDIINSTYISPYIVNEIYFIDSFPRNKLGKCCRNKLVDQYRGERA